MNTSSAGDSENLQDRPLQIGFIPDNDCAPIVIAHESGLFEKYELRVELHRETRWASIRDKVIHGELDAAHAPATLPFITNLGLDSDQCACVTGMVLSLQGNAITVSRELWDEGVRDAETLRELIYRKWGRRTFTIGIVFPHSPPYFLLREWLKQGGIIPGIEVRIVVVPPAQLFPLLNLGYIDGFCGGEPWTSLATESGTGRRLVTSAEMSPLHPEKVLMVRHDFARERAHEHERLIAALLEACAFCDQPASYPILSEILSRPQYVNAPAACLRNGLKGIADSHPLDLSSSGLNIFHRYQANDPTDSKATWLVDRLYELMDENVLQFSQLRRTPVIKNIFRRDIYERARGLVRSQAKLLEAEADRYSAETSQIV
jgi:ABC-type nitrate/sulfonate/bicarbonate transport system substrate-binding protein